jgi:hypothetical protein
MPEPELKRSPEPTDISRTPAGKLYDRLKGAMWCYPGGWLACIVAGSHEGKPAIYVMTSRELYGFERDKIPAEVDGVPVIVKVAGIPRTG